MITLAALAAAALQVPAGVYSNYRIQRDTGDELGTELDLTSGPKPSILFTLCEGACGLVVRLPVVPMADGRGFTFTYEEPASTGDGKPGPAQAIHFEARLKSGALIVRQLDGYDASPQRLRHRAGQRAIRSRYSR